MFVGHLFGLLSFCGEGCTGRTVGDDGLTLVRFKFGRVVLVVLVNIPRYPRDCGILGRAWERGSVTSSVMIQRMSHELGIHERVA